MAYHYGVRHFTGAAILSVPCFCGSRRFHGLCMLALVTHPDYDIPLPDGHRFPATKFSKLIASLHDQGLFGHFTPVTPTAATPDDLGLVHCPDYIAAIAEGRLPEEALRVLGLKWSSVLRNRSFLAVNGTMLAARHALSHGLACHAAGGTHHAHFDYGAGFCVFNDLAFTARRLIVEGAVRSVLILDCDVHQGTAPPVFWQMIRRFLHARCTAGTIIRRARRQAILI